MVEMGKEFGPHKYEAANGGGGGGEADDIQEALGKVEVSEEDRRAWSYHERQVESPEITRIKIIPYPEAVRMETRLLLEDVLETPATVEDRYGKLRDANAIRNRARVLRRGKAGKEGSRLGAYLRFREIPDRSVQLLPEPQGLEELSDYDKARLGDAADKVEENRKNRREEYQNKAKKHEVLRDPLTKELESLADEFASVLRISQAYSNHWQGSSKELALSYIKTPRELLISADDLLALFNAPRLAMQQPLSKGKRVVWTEKEEDRGEERFVYPVPEKIIDGALNELERNPERNGNAPLGHNIDKVMRLCLLISLSEDGEKVREWKEKVKNNSARIIKERQMRIEKKAEEEGREPTEDENREISELNKVARELEKDKEAYWRYLFGVSKDDWEMYIGNEDQLLAREERKDETEVYNENDKGIRGLLLSQGNIWSLSRRKQDKEQIKEQLKDVMGGDKLAVELGVQFHVAFGTMAQFGVAYYDFKKTEEGGMFSESSVEGFPYMTEDVRFYNFDLWQTYKGLAAGPHGNEEGRPVYGPLALSLLKYTETFRRDVNGAKILDLVKKTDEGEEIAGQYAEYIIAKWRKRDQKGKGQGGWKTLKGYRLVGKDGKPGEKIYLSPDSTEEDVSRAEEAGVEVEGLLSGDLKETWVNFFDLWQEGRRVGDLPWDEAIEDPWRVWMLRLFFAGREGGLMETLTKDKWSYEDLLVPSFWEGFKLSTKVLIKKQLIENSEFWQGVVKNASEYEVRASAEEVKREGEIKKLREDDKVKIQLVKNYIYTKWWEGIKKLPYYSQWLIPSVAKMESRALSETVRKKVPAEEIVALAKKHGINLGDVR